MAQIFPRSANTLAKATLVLVAVILMGVGSVELLLPRTTYWNKSESFVEQPVQFSHKHHVGDDGIDCRYCHTSVESSNSAGMPPTKTCMNCHSQLWATTTYLEPVRNSWKTGQPIRWQRVYDLPDYVYFNHSIHVNKGVGCATCHGRVDEMALTVQIPSLQMEWCLDCHRAPEKYLRPRNQVFNMQYVPPTNQIALGMQLKKEYNVLPKDMMTSCSTCHR